ncbi:MAG: enoyl-CoA hydratase/isomerase family protein [Candidatus Geothermincolia bacterium]
MGVWSAEKVGRVAVLRIDKPPLNLVHLDDILEMAGILGELRVDPEVRSIILTGSGRSFIGGADISSFQQIDSAVTAKYVLQTGQRILRDMEEMEKPVIAAINGFTFGGGLEVALACDIRMCNEYAKFGQLEINYGVMPGWAGTQRLTKIVGLGRAKDLVLTGRIIDAQEALMMGLVSRVVSADKLMDETLEVAKLLASKAPVAMALAKEAVNAAAEASIPLGGALEAAACAITFGMEDSTEGVKAFLEKREPDFKGR